MATTVTTRAANGGPLTNTQIDTNFTNLRDGKVDLADRDATAGVPSLVSYKIKFLNAAGGAPAYLTHANAAATRTYMFPDIDGRVQLSTKTTMVQYAPLLFQPTSDPEATSGYGFLHYYDGAGYYLLTTNSGNSKVFNGLRPLSIAPSTGRVTLGNGFTALGACAVNGQTPTAPTGVGSASGGSLAAGTYYAKVIAIDALSNSTLPSANSVGVAVSGGASSIVWTISRSAVARVDSGGAGYRLFVGTIAGSQTLYVDLTGPFAWTTIGGQDYFTYTQTADLLVTGSLTTVDTTGSLQVSGFLSSYYTSMSHATTSRSSDAIFYSSTDVYIRKNDAPGMRSSLAVPGLATVNTFTKAQRGAFVELTPGTTVTPDFSLGNNYNLRTGSAATIALAMPTNLVEGQSGVINVYHDVLAAHSISFAGCYSFAGGTAIALTTSAPLGTRDMISYNVDYAKSLTATVTTTGLSHDLTSTSHGLVAGQKITFTATGGAPTGLSLNTLYYVGNVGTNTFRLYTSLALAVAGGASTINVSTAGTVPHTFVAASITLAIAKAIA